MTTAPVDQLRSALADRYRLERELGQGGMATVYLAQDLRHERKVAIKVLRPELAAVIGAERFVREIRTVAALQHPHILGLIDSGEVSGTAYYVMPFVEGESLRDRLVREKQLPIADAVRIAKEVASALDYAHRHGVIHRDIKPENILLHDGQALVADFGIALAVSQAGGTRMTETGMSLGTPHYMSPEQAMGEREITARSDVYALGCVTYEMLTGDPPFTGSTAQAIVAKVMTDEPMPPRRHRKTVPEAVEAAVLTALEKLPADRFPSAAAFAEALSGSSTVPVRAVGGAVPARRWLADRRSWAALVVAAGSLGAAGALLVRGREHAGDMAAMSAVQNTFGRETVVAARWAPDGATIIYSAARGGRTPRLYLVRPDYPEPQPIGPDSVRLLAVSSKGELAILTHAVNLSHRLYVGTLARMPLGGGAPREIMNGVGEADWSPDGSRLAITRLAGARVQLEYPAGHAMYQSRPGGYVSDIRISPRGDRIALFAHDLAGDDRGYVVVVDTAGVADTLGRSEFWGLEGLAWADPRSVVFSGASQGGAFQIHRAELGGVPRLVLPSAGSLTLMDAVHGDRWLVSRDDMPLTIVMKGPGTAPIRDLSWLDNSIGASLSSDGTVMAFTDQSTAGGNEYSTMVRKTDGSPVVRLGPGAATSISPDGRLVLSQLPSSPSQWILYPIGAGETRRLTWPRLEQSGVGFFPDSRSLIVCGNEVHKAPRCYRSPLDGGSLEPVGPDSIGGGFLRPDGRAMAVRHAGGRWIYPLDGGAPVAIPGLADSVPILRWSPDGRALWVVGGSEGHQKVDQVDVATGRRSAVLDIEPPPTATTLFGTFGLVLADDPHTYAYSVWNYSSELFTIQGVR
jgi:Tol biopolymer transport system component/tRNA A-37 threonylcarbamoyl transferase component Bud32